MNEICKTFQLSQNVFYSFYYIIVLLIYQKIMVYILKNIQLSAIDKKSFLVSLAQLMEIIHSICKIRENPDHHKKKVRMSSTTFLCHCTLDLSKNYGIY